jgi:hypothetical protein
LDLPDKGSGRFMPLNLHADCKARLLEVLTGALPVIETMHGMFLDRRSVARFILADMVLPQSGKLHDRLVDYIDEFPLTDFVTETLGEELWYLDKYLGDSPTVNLSAIEGYGDPSLVAARLVESFDTLPCYQLTFALPQQISGLLPPSVDEFSLSPKVRLVRATERFAQEFPFSSENKKRQQRMKVSVGLLSSLLFDDPASWKKETLYLQILTEGWDSMEELLRP